MPKDDICWGGIPDDGNGRNWLAIYLLGRVGASLRYGLAANPREDRDEAIERDYSTAYS